MSTIPDPCDAYPEPPEHIFPATMSREEYDEDIGLRVAAIRRLIVGVTADPDAFTPEQVYVGIDGICHAIERTIRRYGSAA